MAVGGPALAEPPTSAART